MMGPEGAAIGGAIIWAGIIAGPVMGWRQRSWLVGITWLVGLAWLGLVVGAFLT